MPWYTRITHGRANTHVQLNENLLYEAAGVFSAFLTLLCGTIRLMSEHLSDISLHTVYLSAAYIHVFL